MALAVLLAVVITVRITVARRLMVSETGGLNDTQRDKSAAGMRPISPSMYGAGGCPFASKLFGQLPPDFEMWEDNLIQAYHTAWEAAGSPAGVRLNDHNYNTALGQGNTLAFVAANLVISDDIPDNLKHGLFAESGRVIPAVVRFSDFGGDGSTHKLARMAVKVPLASAWTGEANLLFTETMDSFVIADYGELSAFAGDTHLHFWQRWWQELRNAADMVNVLVEQNFKQVVLGNIFKKEVLAKNYYGQLPYMLGDSQSMKFSLIPRQRTCGEEGAEAPCCLPPTGAPTDAAESAVWATAKAHVTADYLAKCNAVFDLQLQVKEINAESEEMIMKRAAARWMDEPVTVGVLTIPQQECNAEWAVGTRLRDSIASALGVEPTGVDKMFAFHPISTHEDNRPVGEINTFRAAFYSQHNAERFSTIHQGVMLDTSGRPADPRMPFKMPTQVWTQ